MRKIIKLRNLEQLQNELEGDLAWRKKEMLSLKLLIERDKVNESILLRAGITLLSAHFEGFVKKASNCYIAYVAGQKVSYNDLKLNFVALKMEKEFENCAKSEKNSVHVQLLDKYNELLGLKFYEKYDLYKPYISTHSNPSSEELKEILKSLGIESEIFKTKSHYIDSSLLANRHSVVHGDKSELDKEDFLRTFDIVMNLIEDYLELVLNSAERKIYLK